MRAFVALLVALNVCVWGLLVPAQAGAYPQPSSLAGYDVSAVCPPRPSDYSGTDPSVEALTVVAQELADSCARREQLAEAAETERKAIAVATKASRERLDGWQSAGLPGYGTPPGVEIVNWEAQPAGSVVSFSTAAQTNLDSIRQQTERSGVLIIGGIVGAMVAAALSRMWRP